MEQRWRYQKSDDTPVWLSFRPDFPCLYCGYPVESMSTSGPAVCGSCACGHVRKSQEQIEVEIRMKDESGLGKALDHIKPRWREHMREYPERGRHNIIHYTAKARQRLDDLPFDPEWEVYERAYLAGRK